MFSVIPGFRLSLGITLTYLGLIVLLPIAALILQAADVGLVRYWAIITSRARWPPSRSPSAPPLPPPPSTPLRADAGLGSGAL